MNLPGRDCEKRRSRGSREGARGRICNRSIWGNFAGVPGADFVEAFDVAFS